MRWFLTEKKTGSRKTKRKARGASQPWDAARTLRGLWVLAAVLGAVGLGVGYHQLEQHLGVYASRVAKPIDAQNVVLVDVPRWLAPAEQQKLAHTVANQIGADPLDGHGLRVAVMALEQEPWVASVTQVQRLSGGRVEVQAVYREPLAVVEARDGYHLVDAGGIRLPGLYMREHVGALGLPLITGVASAPPAALGQSWFGRQILVAS